MHDLYTKSLRWREENNIDEIRDKIVTQGCDHPRKFPHADKVIDHNGLSQLLEKLCVERNAISTSYRKGLRFGYSYAAMSKLFPTVL